jgi:hypothetical protein
MPGQGGNICDLGRLALSDRRFRAAADHDRVLEGLENQRYRAMTGMRRYLITVRAT